MHRWRCDVRPENAHQQGVFGVLMGLLSALKPLDDGLFWHQESSRVGSLRGSGTTACVEHHSPAASAGNTVPKGASTRTVAAGSPRVGPKLTMATGLPSLAARCTNR